MCGIAGLVSLKVDEQISNKIVAMTDAIIHRGPDSGGTWVSESMRIGLAHRRLSILDLSEAGNQPMHFENRYSIVFNGEIYNYLELRSILVAKGYQFKTATDTEIIMACYDFYGEQFLNELNGMFAFALFDSTKQKVILARDRFGEKPLFYFKDTENFYFASEMKSLWTIGVKKEISDKYLFNYIEYGFTYNPENLNETFYKNIYSVPHSHYLTLDVSRLEFKIRQYYDIDYRLEDSQISFDEAKIRFKDLFYDSVKLRLRSDVPVGTSLSGGLDSTAVVCAMNNFHNCSQKIKTFSARFPGFNKDESKYIDIVLNQIKADGYSVFPENSLEEDVLAKVAYHQEIPVASNSILAQYYVMKLAKDNNVIVLLDGQGADEILAGYPFYYFSYFSELFNKSKSEFTNQLRAYSKLHINNDINKRISSSDFLKTAIMMNYFSDFYKKSRNKLHSGKSRSVFCDSFYSAHLHESFKFYHRFQTLNEALYATTMKGNLQELLRYADRNSMANSREVRLPFLDHRIVEFMFSLPCQFKINNGWTKFIMREALSDIMPPQIAWRKDKIGYEPSNFDRIDNFEPKLELLNRMHITRLDRLNASLQWRINQIYLI